MPTFTAVALETLLESTVRDSYKKPLNSGDELNNKQEREKQKKKASTPNHIYIQPALYVTPEPTPIPEVSSGSLSPSPYVVNHKRRGGKAVNRRTNEFEIPKKNENLNSNSNVGEEIDEGELRFGEIVEDNFLGAEVNGDGNEGFVVEEDDFVDPRCDSLSVASSSELIDLGKQSFVSNPGEFFDADEDFSSSGSISNSNGPSVDLELRAIRVGLMEEIERRKAAEDAVAQMYSQWQRIGNLLSQAGLSFPTSLYASSGTQLEIGPVEQLSQEIVVARFVAEAIGKGQARAEAELVADVIIESKDQEISRLRDRVQYYESVNHEMSQRNQEIMEVARRQRQRKRSQRRWLWGCVGLSVVIGASVIAYSYLPDTSEHHSLPGANESSNAASTSSSESAY
ncbi:unnamed protein product [Ilex paraguariensis]|uniref:Uncharacterized protein n=1 Tax=Ilex paraguariensis TaxID=185542 RepID=A0ABC8R7R8_9AQUA